jgi:hypothetical protein
MNFMKEWIRSLLKIFRQDLQDYYDFFVDHFPEESDPTQSAWRRKVNNHNQTLVTGLYVS